MNANPLPRPSRWLLVLGLTLPVLAVLGYLLQLSQQRLTTPWYVPMATTLAVLCLVIALYQRLTVVRWMVLVLLLLLAAFEWSALLSLRLAAYTGPVATGQPFPAFKTQRADGTPFTERNLPGDRDTVMVFFRGRW